jgi:hypothetical protein
MTKISSTMLSVGTLLRRAEDTGASVRVLVQGTWLDGRVLGCDGLGAVLDDGGRQALVRLDQVAAVTFCHAEVDDIPGADREAHPHRQREPIEAGPVTSRATASPTSDFAFIPPRPR